jgi:micrococcal nuclease
MKAVAFLRRGSPRGKILVAVLIAAVFAVAAIPNVVSRATDKQAISLPQTLNLPPGVTLDQLQQAQVDEVVDGDTINVRIGKTFAVIRYYGVDTPERGEACYNEATNRNTDLLGLKIYLLGDARDEDQFGRSLRYVFLANGQSVDATLVAEGLGHAWMHDGRYRDQIAGLETEARSAHRGCLWK